MPSIETAKTNPLEVSFYRKKKSSIKATSYIMMLPIKPLWKERHSLMSISRIVR